MNWFSKHPQWLYSQSIELSNNTIYKEKYQFIDETFLSTGDVIVHKEKTEYYPILIVYPESTPYLPPIIYILNNSLDEKTSESYAHCSLEEIKKAVVQNVRFFNRRHQNEDGSICFLEAGDLHEDTAEFYPIKDILKRLRIWLSGRIPKDSREVELFAHFKDKYEKMQFLLPDTFFDIEIVKGLFYAGLPNFILANFLSIDYFKKTYMGICIVGENSAGVSLPPKIYRKKERVLYTDLPDNLLKFIKGNKNEKILKYIEEEKIIEGYWWDICHEPEPFSELSRLAYYIGNGDEKKGLHELTHALKHPLNSFRDVIYLGLRFPGRWQGKDWQIFRLEKGNRPPILQKDQKELAERLGDYSIKVVRQEYFTEDYFHMRNRGRADRNILKDTQVSIIGCGALGSELSDCLGKAGVGEILLVDKEEMRAHNTMRHCLGITRIGHPKVLGMAELLLLHNPFVNVQMEGIDILKSEVEKYLPNKYVGISTIADDNIDAYLNEKAIENERLVFYCRALRGGKVARIFRVRPHEDACKNCLSLYRQEKKDVFINIAEDKDLPTLTNECNNPVRPASAADLKLIASLTARIIIDYLQGGLRDKNHWIWSSEHLEKLDFKPSEFGIVYSQFLPPHPHCPLCQKLKDKEVFIIKEAHDLMKKEATISGNSETGGLLIGYMSEKGQNIILKATLPGPKAVKTPTSFEKDEEYCQKELENAMREFGSKGIYLGEWHYHPTGSNLPSGLDIKSLTEIAQQENYRIELPVLIILSPSFEFALTIHDKNSQCIQLPLKIVNDITAI